MPDPATPPQWEALDRREVAHLLLGMVPTSFEDAMRHVIELERRGIFVVRAVPSAGHG